MVDGEILRIEPGAAERIARAFEVHADNLLEVSNKLRRSGFSTGFAGFPSAVELDIGFSEKRNQAISHLLQQVETARVMAATIRAAGAAYRGADTEAGRAIHSAAGGSGQVTGP